MYKISTIAKIINGNFLINHDDTSIEHLLIDSRKLLFPNTSLFFAIAGPRRQGDNFIADLYNKGVRNFIVDKNFLLPQNEYINANIIEVENVLSALQKLAAYHRSVYLFPVIGITGSNGKTIVKEWLYQLLQQDYNIVRSPKSYNSQIGVPISVWQINSNNNLGIFEAGISLENEMEKLQKIIQPTVGIFTNIGEAHNEGFKNLSKKIEEKILLFKDAEIIIYCKDEVMVDEALANIYQKNNTVLFSWGNKNNAILKITATQIHPFNTVIKAIYKSRNISIAIPFTNDAAIKNAITCWCVLLNFNISDEIISDRMLQLKPVEMRLELKEGINNCSIINDSYNADVTSLSIALNFLQQQQQHPKRTVIISDILQSGKTDEALYTEVASILKQKNVNRLIGIGQNISKYKLCFDLIKDKIFFSNTTGFLNHFSSLHFFNETILLKGARVFEFEQLSHLLEQKSHQTVLEINLNAITHNLNIYQQQLNTGVKLMAMVKAFSYGSGSFEIANLLQFHKVDYLAVAYVDEAIALRKASISLPIMVMNVEEATCDILVKYNLEPELFSFPIYNAFENYLQQSAITNYPVHIKLDTGMHRLGFEAKDIDELCKKIKSSSSFKIQSVFSHLAASENVVHDDFTQFQAKIFLQLCDELQKHIDYPFLKHIANSSAIFRHKNLQFDMVRLGIGLYGIDANSKVQQQLKNVSTLKTTISQIKKIKAGESIGYSRKGIAEKDTTIATVRIGYADGYPRSLSNGVGKMLLNGKIVSVIGNICMDMTMLDITEQLTANEGDDIIVFGEQLSVAELSNWANTIPYEILTGISQRVKRIYFEE